MTAVFTRAWEAFRAHTNPPVFIGAASAVVCFFTFGGIFTQTAADLFGTLQQRISQLFGWYYALVTTSLLVFSLWLMLGRHGRLRLGPDDAKPEFSYLSWFAMLFSAGMGIGIVFWGVAEPLHHYANPPVGSAKSNEAAKTAMQYTFFHWGLQPWGIYAVMSTAIAFLHFRKGLPLAPHAILYPLVGKRAFGWRGHIVDILCTVGTLLGVATSLGLGAMQINAGVAEFAAIPESISMQVGIIALITLVATISVVSGIHAGIRRLSFINCGLSLVLLLFIFLSGPTIYLLETFVGSLGAYLHQLVYMSLWVDFTSDNTWQSQWTFFYWGWWISWSPFVGVFVARISRGRTIREFILCTLFVPTLGTFLWLATFGGAALHLEIFGVGGLIETVQENVAISLHALLDHYPFAPIMKLFATAVIVIFFITSSDSGSLVDDMVTSGGDPNPPKIQRVFWAVSEGAVASILLLVGGLRAMQDASISMGFLMSFVLILCCVSLQKAFRS